MYRVTEGGLFVYQLCDRSIGMTADVDAARKKRLGLATVEREIGGRTTDSCLEAANGQCTILYVDDII